MAVLSNDDRQGVRDRLMRDLSSAATALGITKPQLRAVVDAMDSWADSNATSLNNAIPQPQRGILTSKQKALILMAVIARRYEVA